jgi:hypothetical protein
MDCAEPPATVSADNAPVLLVLFVFAAGLNLAGTDKGSGEEIGLASEGWREMREYRGEREHIEKGNREEKDTGKSNSMAGGEAQ